MHLDAPREGCRLLSTWRKCAKRPEWREKKNEDRRKEKKKKKKQWSGGKARRGEVARIVRAAVYPVFQQRWHCNANSVCIVTDMWHSSRTTPARHIERMATKGNKDGCTSIVIYTAIRVTARLASRLRICMTGRDRDESVIVVQIARGVERASSRTKSNIIAAANLRTSRGASSSIRRVWRAVPRRTPQFTLAHKSIFNFALSVLASHKLPRIIRPAHNEAKVMITAANESPCTTDDSVDRD